MSPLTSPLPLICPACLRWIQLIRARCFHCHWVYVMENSRTFCPMSVKQLFSTGTLKVTLQALYNFRPMKIMHLPQRAWQLAGMLSESMYGQASLRCHILCSNRKQPNCRPLLICVQTDRAKYSQGQAALVYPEGTRFLSLWHSLRLEQRCWNRAARLTNPQPH